MRFILGVVSALALLGAGAVTISVLSATPSAPRLAAAPAAPVATPAPEVMAEEALQAAPATVTKSATMGGLEDIKTVVRTTMPHPPETVISDLDVVASAMQESPLLNTPVLATPQSVDLDAEIAQIEAQPNLSAVTFLAAVDESSPVPPVADTVPPAPVEVLYVTGRRVNMRSGPGSRYGWVATLERGAQLMVVEKGDRWHKVSGLYEGNVVRGWMAGNFLSPDPMQIEALNATN